MTHDPDIIEAAARALHWDDWGVERPWESAGGEDMDYYRNLARELLPAVTPLIRAATLEEAARAFEPDEDGHDSHSLRFTAGEVAAVLRAFKEPLKGRPALRIADLATAIRALKKQL